MTKSKFEIINSVLKYNSAQLIKYLNNQARKIKLPSRWEKVEEMDISSETDSVISYYVWDHRANGKRKYSFHPAFPIFSKILSVLKEYEFKNNINLSEKEYRIFIGLASNNFEKLEQEYYNIPNNSDSISRNDGKIKRLVLKIITKLLRSKESKSSVSALNVSDRIHNSY